MINVTPYNPLDERNLGASVAEALLEGDAVQIDQIPLFPGAGIYAIYYIGDDPMYAGVAAKNRDGAFSWPIYVGKAMPSGGRKGKKPTKREANPLWGRVDEHRESIKLASDLRVQDFFVRTLVVAPIWIPLGESLLIAKFAPIWNTTLDGFGNHNPGSGRYKGKRPRWDVVHKGRAWALKCAERVETAEQLIEEVMAQIRVATVPTKLKLLTEDKTELLPLPESEVATDPDDQNE